MNTKQRDIRPTRPNYSAVADLARRSLRHSELDGLVALADKLGNDPYLFCSRAAAELELAVSEMANPRTKESKAYKKAAAQFKRLALGWRDGISEGCAVGG